MAMASVSSVTCQTAALEISAKQNVATSLNSSPNSLHPTPFPILNWNHPRNPSLAMPPNLPQSNLCPLLRKLWYPCQHRSLSLKLSLTLASMIAGSKSRMRSTVRLFRVRHESSHLTLVFQSIVDLIPSFAVIQLEDFYLEHALLENGTSLTLTSVAC